MKVSRSLSMLLGMCAVALLCPLTSVSGLIRSDHEEGEGPVAWEPSWKTRWESTVLAVGHAHATMDTAFSESMQYWESGWLFTGTWTHIERGDLKEPLKLEGPASILIEGDCLADISVAGDALIHILGNVSAKIVVGEQSEIIIGQDVTAKGRIETGPIVRVFVGGNFDGVARESGSTWWIVGSVRGQIETGAPHTCLHVGGDFLGTISPLDKAMLSMVVKGFVPSKTLYSVADLAYTRFEASIGISDMPRGLYPRETGNPHVDNRRHSSRWVVHRQRSE